MREDDYDTAIKVVIVGNGSVGKSSLIQRFCNGIFTSEYKRTIGVDFLERTVKVGNQEIRLMLWDTAGQEEFGALTKAYYRGAHACLIVFSTTDRDSFTSVNNWKNKVEFECGSIPMVVVQNKIDLLTSSVVSFEEVDNLCRHLKLKLFRTSVKEALNVKEVFQFVAESYVDSIRDFEEELVPSFGASSLKSSLVRPSNMDTTLSNTLFITSSAKFYKRNNKYINYCGQMNQRMYSPSESLMSVIPHYRYRKRYQFIPLGQSNGTISLHGRSYTKRRSKKLFKNALFKSCWIL